MVIIDPGYHQLVIELIFKYMKNKTNKYSKIVKKISKDYYKTPGLLGIIWIGSATLGINDKHADIDIRLITSCNKKRIPMKQFNVNNIKVEVDEMSWNWLTEDKNIDSERFWIREKAIIMHDPNNKLFKTFKKINQNILKKYKDYLFSFYKDLFFDHEIELCLERRELETAQLYIFKSMEALIKFLFIYNKMPVPPFKWRVNFLKRQMFKQKKLVNDILRLFHSKLTVNEQLSLLLRIKKDIQKMMIAKGYNRQKVMEFWRF